MKILYRNQQIKPKKKLLYSNPVELAMNWQRGLEDGRYVSKATIAREVGISRARVTQIMNLLKISPALLESPHGALSERKIRDILKRFG